MVKRHSVKAIIAACSALLWVTLAPPVNAHAADDPAATSRAVAWLAKAPTSTLDLEDRVDLVIAYESVGAPRALVDPLIADISFLIGDGAELSTRTLAKTIVALDIAGRSLTIGGRNLPTELRAQQGRRPDAQGEFHAPFGDELSTQAWSILAMARTGDPTTSALGFLKSQQCPDGRFVFAPTPQSCAVPVDQSDQALVLTTLVAAAKAGLRNGGSIPRLTTAVRDFAGTSVAPWPTTAASVLAWLVWPLQAIGESALADQAQTRVQSLQLAKRTAVDPGQVGAIGGENASLVAQLRTSHLDPATALTVAALHAFHPVNLVSLTYRPSHGLANLKPAGPSVVGKTRAQSGTSVRLLAQGFTPNSRVSLAVDGVNVTTVRANRHGSTTLKFTPSAKAVPRQQLTISSGPTERVIRTIDVTRKLDDHQDSNSIGTHPEARPFALSLPGVLGIGGAVVLVLCISARVLGRDEEREKGRSATES